MFHGVDTTTFSLDIYGRFISMTWQEEVEGREQDVDVIVIGSGMFGGYCGSHLYNQSRLMADQGKIFRPLKVLVLEAGPFVFIQHQQNQNIFIGNGNDSFLHSTDPKLNSSQDFVWGWDWRWNPEIIGYAPTAYCVGGKSLFWGGWAPRMTEADLKNWPKEVVDYLIHQNASPVTSIPYTDPINDLPIQGAYSVLEYETGVLPSDDFIFDPKEGPNASGGLNKILSEKLQAIFSSSSWNDSPEVQGPRVAVQTQSFISGLFALDKYSSLPGLITAIRNDAGDNASDRRLILVPNTKVLELIPRNFSQNNQSLPGNVVGSIRVRLQNGEEKTMTIPDSCAVVLAMNTADSTRLALAGFPGIRKRREANGNIEARPDLMGANLMVHFRFDIMFRIKRTDVDARLGPKLSTAINHIQFDNPELGRYHFQFYAADNDQGNPDAYLYRFIPDYDYLSFIANTPDRNDFVSFIIRTTGEMKGLLLNKEDIASYDKYKGGQDYIDLTKGLNTPSDIDPFGDIRRPWVQYKAEHYSDPIWQTMYDQAIKLSLALAGNDPSKVNYKVFDQQSMSYTNNFAIDPPSIPLIGFRQSLGSTYHEAGTLWMGDDPETSVTDVNGCFHQIPNLYSCGQPLFPTIGSANPVLTGLALTKKVADGILSRHMGDPFSYDLTGFSDLALEKSWENLSSSINQNVSGLVFLKDAGNHNVLSSFFGNDIGFGWFTEKTFKNFELYVQWRVQRSTVGEVANSGILLRMPSPTTYQAGNSNLFYEQLIEIQIDDSGKDFLPGHPSFYGAAHKKTGAIYSLAPATRWEQKIAAHPNNLFPPTSSHIITPDDQYWNTYHITAADSRIIIELNRKLISQTNNLPPNLVKPGFIGLQVHTGNVQFKNIFIKEL
ncbi:MAG: family 16 glycoside hydrolase [Flavisolibacter sp.]